MRIACYGWVSSGGPSLAGAHSLVLRELLNRGHTVHLYANPDHVIYPRDLAGPNFAYIPVKAPWALDVLPRRFPQFANYALSPLVRAVWRRQYEPEAHRRHRVESYDILMSLGTPPVFRIQDVPVFVWLQGPPDTEKEAIRDLRSIIVGTSGVKEYLYISLGYRLRKLVDPFKAYQWDGVACGSSWSAAVLAKHGVPPSHTYRIPYPVDLEMFCPHSPDTTPNLDPLILSIGRLDPRKRIDLVLDAFKHLSQQASACRLIIVGSIRYAKGQRQLIDQAVSMSDVVYIEQLPRSDIADLMRAASVLVQPSMNENFGSAVAEALSCGTPVVVGPTNGTSDYISSTSVTIDRYDSVALAEGIELILSRLPEQRSEIQASARRAAEEHFAVEHVVTRLEVALKETIDRGRALSYGS